jgi:WhiB family redox-sensing transcriptional regulator
VSRIIRIERPAFFTDAACRGMGPAQWFPSKGKATNAVRERCAACPVVRECLDYALADPTLQGIWGGTSEEQRDQLRRRRSA